MLSAAIFIPLVGALLLSLWRPDERLSRSAALGFSALPLLLLVWAWRRFDPSSPELFQLVEQLSWMPSIGAAYRVGLDGISLALGIMTAVLFMAASAFPVDTKDQAPQYYAWLLFLLGVCLGLFLALDLLLFYVFFDLTLVGMYFLIGRWGHGDPQRAALKFFLFTFLGSLTVLLAILGLYLASDPRTFDMAELIAAQPLAGSGAAGIVMFGFLFGFAVKTPLIPVHTWLPPAHVDAPAPASTILAGVMLKIGTFGMIRIPLVMMRDTAREFAWALAALATVSVVYGALVSLGQRNLKARIAYTSVAHMGLVVLGIAVAAWLPAADATRRLALSGAVVGMIAHGLITGALFLMAGVFWKRSGSYDMDSFGGLAGRAPRLTTLAVVGCFGGLGLPGLLQFIADFQVLAAAVDVVPVFAVIALLGLLLLAALFVQLLQDVFLGEPSSEAGGFADTGASETAAIGALLLAKRPSDDR
ncbi:MAG: NADH-quinone oxidoreductase subunit M [Actinobacteria bacterium]|nr:NADH-quinone oxidoreductase subunit M [Actinomycetota bacterium]